MLESWSSSVHTIRSPETQWRDWARVKANIRLVVLGPKTISSASAPTRAAVASRARCTTASLATLAPNTPPRFAGAGEVM